VIAGLVISALLADDGLTARELGIVLGLEPVEMRLALRELVDDGVLVTSGRTSGTRYCLAIEDQPVVAHIGGPRVRLPKVRTVPATLDLMAALTETAALVANGVSLQGMRAIALDRRTGAMAG
jgi:hypothetical protein